MAEDATLESILPSIMHKLNWLDKEELLRRLMLMEFRRLLDYYESVEEIDEADERSRERGESDTTKRSRQAEPGMSRLFINFGKTDHMFPNKLIELINKCVPGRVKVGKIDLMSKFSFFEVAEEDAREVVESMSQYEVDGRRIVVDFAEKAPSDGGKKGRRETAKRRTPGFGESRSYGSGKRETRREGARSERPAGRRGAGRKSNSDEGGFYDKYDRKRNR